MNKQQRLELANKVIEEISKHGRKFFTRQGRIARLEIDRRGRIWFVDDHTQARIYTHYKGRWNWRFSYGYTMQSLIHQFVEFIQTGDPNLNIFSLGYELPEFHNWGYPLEDLLPIWEVAKPMLSPVGLQQLDHVLSELQKVA
jgi:hypothetical protein